MSDFSDLSTPSFISPPLPDPAKPGLVKPGADPFDGQAGDYDRRVGLPESCRVAVVAAILRLSGLQPGELLVEAGAGTGQIGEGLARSPIQYLGFDRSEGMLEQFRARLEVAPPKNWTLLQADGNQSWPVGDRSARAIFSSRAIHLFNQEFVLRECDRVADPAGAVLLIGRVQRSPGSIKAQMQQQMRRQLSALGGAARNGAETKDCLLQSCCDRGGQLLTPVTAARWSVQHSPRQSLENWQGKPGLGGVDDLPEATKQTVLANLREWAIATFGDLDQVSISEETYCLEGVRL